VEAERFRLRRTDNHQNIDSGPQLKLGVFPRECNSPTTVSEKESRPSRSYPSTRPAKTQRLGSGNGTPIKTQTPTIGISLCASRPARPAILPNRVVTALNAQKKKHNA